MQLEPQPLKGFLLKLIQLYNLEYIKEVFLSMEAWGGGGHHVATCRSEWQLGRTSSLGSSSSSISSLGFSTSSLAAVCATNCSARFKGNQRGGTRIIWARPQVNW